MIVDPFASLGVAPCGYARCGPGAARRPISAPASRACAARRPPRAFPAQAFDAATRGLEPDLKILELMDNQPEFKTPIWDYLAALVDEERVQDGRAAMRQWGQALAAAEARYGVDRYVIAGRLGRRIEFRQGYRRPAAGAVARDPRPATARAGATISRAS